MKFFLLSLFLSPVFLGASDLSAQTLDGQQTVPQMLPVSGTLVGMDGKALTGATVVTFSIYEEQEGGAPLWVDAQEVAVDERGRFVAWLGQGQSLPMDIFQSGQARWIGVQPVGLPEEPRARFLPVPYAFKAIDAQTLGGLPASAFLLAAGAPVADTKARSWASGQEGSRPATADRDAGSPVTDDVVTADDAIIQGSLCAGLDCVNNEVFGFDTIRMKENNTRVTFMDTSAAGAFPDRDWRLRANSSASGGQNAFFIDDLGSAYTTGDETVSSTPFTIEAAAPTNAFYLASSGRVGFGTSAPVLNLHSSASNTPAIRMEQNSSGGFTAQTWDIASNEANFFIRDVTGGSKLPFRIRPGAPSSSIDVAASGNVGIGVSSPSSKLAVDGSLDTTNGSNRSLTLRSQTNYNYKLQATGDDFQILEAGSTPRLHIDYPGGQVGINTSTPGYQLDVNGSVGVSGNIDTAIGGNRSLTLRSATNYNYVLQSTGDDFQILEAGTTPRFHIDYPGGNIGLGTTSPAHPLQMASGAYVSAGGVWTNASSRALKDQIEDLSANAAAAALAALNPVRFVYKTDPSDLQVGFIAEDVPDLVASADRKGLSAMDIVAVLTKVTQNQQQAINRLEQQVNALTAMVERLARER